MIDPSALDALFKRIAADGLTRELRASAVHVLGSEAARSFKIALAVHAHAKRRPKPRVAPAHRERTVVIARAYLAVQHLIKPWNKQSRIDAFEMAIRSFWTLDGARAAFPNGKVPEADLQTAIIQNKGRARRLAKELAAANKI